MNPTTLSTSRQASKQASALTIPVTIARGDGIGGEIMDATLKILEAAGAPLAYQEIKIGKEVYLEGHKSGISLEAWDVLRGNSSFLKGPITTPQGSGYKSLNVTIRKTLGLFANVRPCKSYMPFVHSHFPTMDLVIIRENEEDLYAGIEHQQTPEVVQCLKLVSRPGCERIIRYAFEYARAYGRKKVTCMSKDNIMKHTDGLFHSVFDEVAKEYPEIDHDHQIIDIGAALLADKPERFDVVVTLNLYGDIISDISAQVAGSVGLGGSANIGEKVSMFEAIHGSAPDIAGKDIANPSGLIHAACMMLNHVGQAEQAALIQNALLTTLEDGIHTPDLFNPAFSKRKVGTQAFAANLISRLGEKPKKLKAQDINTTRPPVVIPASETISNTKVEKDLVGVDIFLDWDEEGRDPEVIGRKLVLLSGPEFQLKMITNRGVKVYPGGFPETFCTDHWRCRFVSKDSNLATEGNSMPVSMKISYHDVLTLMNRLTEAGLNFIKIENLYGIDGKRAYSLGQGE